MAKTISGMTDKAQSHIKIGNFYVKKKTLIIVGIALLVIIVIIKYNSAQKQKELEERILAQQVAVPIEEVGDNSVVLSLDEQIQMQLRAKYGEPTEGFEWDYQGNLVPLANIEDMSAEDILYTYLQSIHMMDFATAQRVAAKSTIITLVDDYYSEITNAMVTTTDLYKRRLIKLALDKMSIEGISNTIVQANGTYIFTVDLTCLDLTNKEFWRGDEQNIYQSMYVYDKTETDSTKKEQFLYDYIYDAYTKEACGFRKTTVDIIVGKANSGGYLVVDDTPLRKVLLYEDGVDVASYINLQYNDWIINQGYKAQAEQAADVGFGYNEEEYEPSDLTQNSQSSVNQQLQEELEYYKEHGELKPKDNNSNSSSSSSENVESGEDGNTSTETTEGQSGGITEEERNQAAQEQQEQKQVDHSVGTGGKTGFGYNED